MGTPSEDPTSANLPSLGNIEGIIAEEAAARLGGVVDTRRAHISTAFPVNAVVVPVAHYGHGGVGVSDAIQAVGGLTDSG
jgi:hypothetical protein